jgi:FkbM family methyltransferase
MMKKTIKNTIKSLLSKADLKIIRDSQTDPIIYTQNFIFNEKPIIFDIGANKGKTINKFLHVFPNATVHAFEPIPELYKSLNNSFNSANVIVNNCALSENIESSNLHKTSNLDSSSLLRISQDAEKHWGKDILQQSETIKIQTDTVDSYCSSHRIEQIDIMKLDIQGCELSALKGSREMLSNKAVGLILLETTFTPTYSGQCSFGEILDFWLFSKIYG